MRLGARSHSAHSLGSSSSSYLLDKGIKNGQALSPVGKCHRNPDRVAVKISHASLLKLLAAADKNRPRCPS